MTRAFVLSVALFGVLCCARVAAGPGALPLPTFPEPFGVNIHFTQEQPGELDKLAEAYKAVRMDFIWARTEKTKGVYDFSQYDILVRDLEKRKIRPLFILDYGNDLYQKGAPRQKEARTAFAKWAATAAARYKGRGVMWEFWNEPNLQQFWGAEPNPAEYAALVLDAAPAMRKADPDCTLLVGAFAAFPWDYIDMVFRLGTLKWADAVSVHPYRGGPPETAVEDYARLRFLISKYSPKRPVPILSGEWGYSTNSKTGIPEIQQARYLVRQRLTNAMAGVHLSIWYDWKEDGNDPDDNEHHFGSVRPNLEPKPAYEAALVMTKTLSGYAMSRMLVNKHDEFVMLLQNAKGESALAMWTTGPTRGYKVPGPARRVVDMLGKVTRVDSVGDAPIYFNDSPRYVLLGKNPVMNAQASWMWLPPFCRISAGEALSAPFIVSNTSLDTRTYTAQFSIPGGEVVPSTVKVTLGPGESKAVSTTVRLWNRTGNVAASANVQQMQSDGRVISVKSVVPMVLMEPMTVTACLVGGNAVEVTLDMPGGPPKDKVMVGLVDARGADLGKAVTLSPLGKKTTRHVMHIPAKFPASGARTFGVLVRDGKRKTVASLEPVTYTTLYDFEDLKSGLKDLTARKEGNPDLVGTCKLGLYKSNERGGVADLTANFPAGWCYFVVQPKTTVIPKNAVAVGMWVYGDGKGDAVRCRFIDAKNQVYQPTYGNITWKGWRWITMPLTDPKVGSWGGPQDGVIHHPIKWDTVFLLDNVSHTKHSSRILFDDITLLTSVESETTTKSVD